MSLRRQMEKRIDSPDAVASRREGREKCGRIETHCSHCCERPISLLLSWGGPRGPRRDVAYEERVAAHTDGAGADVIEGRGG